MHKYTEGSLAVFHGPRKLADYDDHGRLMEAKSEKVAFANINVGERSGLRPPLLSHSPKSGQFYLLPTTEEKIIDNTVSIGEH